MHGQLILEPIVHLMPRIQVLELNFHLNDPLGPEVGLGGS